MQNRGYLQLHQNPNSRVRADGLRYWGYPTRSKRVQVIGIHTAETGPTPWSAESVADYFTISDRAASYHEVGDSNSHVTCLPTEATAFGAVGWNSNGWHYSFATRAHLWGDNPEWDTAALKIGAQRCRLAAERFGIPIRRISLAQAKAGAEGFIDHGRLDPERRTDPGAKFPWDRFLALVAGTEPTTEPAGDIVRTLRLTFPRLRGNDVKEWQTLIGVTADGIFGPDTDAATRVMQADLGVKVDGIVGPKTRAAATPAPVSAPVSKTEPVGDVDQDTIRRIIREEIDAALGGRNVGTDLRRIRISQRAIGIAVGAPVDHQGPDDGTTVIA